MKIAISFLSAMVFARSASAHSEPLFGAEEGKKGRKHGIRGKGKCEESSDGFIGKFPTKDRRKELNKDKRFGKIFKDKKALDKKFCVIADHLIASFGAVSLTTTLNSPLVKRFWSDPSDSEDEFKLICMATCMEDPICDYAEVSGFAATEKGIAIACTLFTGDESRGGPVYTQRAFQDHANDYTATVLVKKGTGAGAPLEFEGADGPLCDVDLEAYFETGIQTPDFSNYIVPAVMCLGDLESFGECQYCIESTIYFADRSACRSLCLDSAELLCGSTDAESIISQDCAEECKANTCLAKVQKASLCALGSHASEDSVGCVNRRYDDITDDFTCPVDTVN